MEQYNNIVQTIALTLGAGWAAGINLYAAIATLGIMATQGAVDLPQGLEILENPFVIGAACLMYCVEFFADKIPVVDSGWDAIHTFIRIPAGAFLAYGATSEYGVGIEVAAAILGGGMATISHGAKAGTRVIINTSPEPVTNWTASVTEDVAVIGGIWAAINHPFIFLGLLVVFLVFIAWILPKIWRGIKKVFGFIAGLFSSPPAENTEQLTHEK